MVAVPPEYGSVAGQRPRLLVVEDDTELLGALTDILATHYEVRTAIDAPSALEAVGARPFDLVLLDLILPRGTGMEVLGALARKGPGATPPVIVVSALGHEVDLSQFSGLVVGKLCKPFGLAEVERQVAAALTGRRSEPTTTAQRAVSVLLVDDDVPLLSGMADYLEQSGYTVKASTTVPEALAALSSEHFDAIITDWILPGATGLDLLERIRAVTPQASVLILTGYATPDMTRHALAAGAADVLVKPFPARALPVALEKCLLQANRASIPAVPAVDGRHRSRGESPSAVLANKGHSFTAEDISGESPALMRAKQALSRAALLDSSVLIHGETGTGKELFAQALHRLSSRADGPFVAVNAAAIPESLLESELFGYAAGAFTGARKDGQKGKFVQADGGTLFLDEIGDMPLALQVKLLRVLQEGQVDLVGGGTRKVDIRIVAATHQDLETMVARGEFRSDLYYRLNVVTLELPPLRERTGDVPILARQFLAGLCTRYGHPAIRFSTEALDLLAAHSWPGNIRELRNVVERAFAFCSGSMILPVHLPPVIAEGRRCENTATPVANAPYGLASQERTAIIQALEATGGNKLRAAKLLGISRAGLYVKLKVYGIA
jgi:DNA-binding NtrC family response regulator